MNVSCLPHVNFTQAPLGAKKKKDLTQLKLFWGRMGMLRQWLLGNIFTTGFQRDGGQITQSLLPVKCHQSVIYRIIQDCSYYTDQFPKTLIPPYAFQRSTSTSPCPYIEQIGPEETDKSCVLLEQQITSKGEMSLQLRGSMMNCSCIRFVTHSRMFSARMSSCHGIGMHIERWGRSHRHMSFPSIDYWQSGKLGRQNLNREHWDKQGQGCDSWARAPLLELCKLQIIKEALLWELATSFQHPSATQRQTSAAW